MHPPRLRRPPLRVTAILTLGAGLLAAQCPGITQPGNKTFDASSHYQTWTITLIGNPAVVGTARAKLGSTGNGLLETVTPWVIKPSGADPCRMDLTIQSGSVNGSLMSFTTHNTGCGWNVQGTASGHLNGATADVATAAAGTMHISYQSLTALKSSAGDGNWVAARQ